MAATASYATDRHWDLETSHSRRSSTETIFSVQGRETDFARDTSDSEALPDDESGVEYEPVTETEGEAPIDDNTSSASDDDIIQTKVVEVLVGDDKDVQFADSESANRTDSYESDTELHMKMTYHRCVKCKVASINPVYMYCRKCYHIRKSFFPPMPRRKRRRTKTSKSESSSTGASTEYAASQTSSGYSTQKLPDTPRDIISDSDSLSDTGNETRMKRRAESIDERITRKKRYIQASNSESDGDIPVQPIVKTVSDPLITIDPEVKITKKSIANTVLESMNKDLCVVCVSEPKSGVFIHGRIAHICCCYKCAVKVWAKAKRCPVCNCKVSNVLRAVVM